MKIDTRLLAASASRFWRTTSTPPLRITQPAADDVVTLDASPAQPLDTVEPVPLPASKPSPPLPPGDVLHAALLAVAGDDAACAMLLASASPQARAGLSARLVYLEMCHARNPELAALVATLATSDDAARTATLSSASPQMCAQLGEHLWASHAPLDVITQQYMDMLLPSGTDHQ